MSADGLEPSTHALKGRQLRVLPRGTNDLAHRKAIGIGAKRSQSAVNLQLIYILQGLLTSVILPPAFLPPPTLWPVLMPTYRPQVGLRLYT